MGKEERDRDGPWGGAKRKKKRNDGSLFHSPLISGDWRHAMFEVLALSWLAGLAKPFRCSSPSALGSLSYVLNAPDRFGPQRVAPPKRRGAKPVPFAIAGRCQLINMLSSACAPHYNYTIHTLHL